MQRPRPVTLLAVLALFLAFSYLFVGLLLYTGKINLDDLISQLPQLGDMKETFLHTAEVFALLFGLAYLIAGLGLLQLKNWGRATARVLAVLGLLSALVQMIQAFATKDAASFLLAALAGGIYYWAFFYLGQAHVRAAFGPPPDSASQPPVFPGSNSAG